MCLRLHAPFRFVLSFVGTSTLAIKPLRPFTNSYRWLFVDGSAKLIIYALLPDAPYSVWVVRIAQLRVTVTRVWWLTVQVFPFPRTSQSGCAVRALYHTWCFIETLIRTPSPLVPRVNDMSTGGTRTLYLSVEAPIAVSIGLSLYVWERLVWSGSGDFSCLNQLKSINSAQKALEWYNFHSVLVGTINYLTFDQGMG